MRGVSGGSASGPAPSASGWSAVVCETGRAGLAATDYRRQDVHLRQSCGLPGPAARHWAARAPAPPREDVADPLGGQSLHHADWDAVVRHLDGLGWEPSEDEHGDLCHAGYTSDGREVIGLYGREPIIVPTLDEEARAIAALLAHL